MPDPLSFQWLFGIVFGSLFSFQWLSGIVPGSLLISTNLRHRARIPYHFNGSPASCSDPFSFRQLFDIVLGSPIILAALRYCVQILFSFSWLSSIVLESPFHFGGSPTSCLDLICSAALQHRAQILFLFGGSPASCQDPLSF